jgi:hypothetical protein
MTEANKDRGGGVYISPNIKKVSVVITKDGQEIEVKTPQEKDEVIRKQIGK